MTNHVADICVGKMTEKEAIHEIELMEQMECACPDCERRRPALQMAIKALQFQQSVVKCKDCSHKVDREFSRVICVRHSIETHKDGYCHAGKRRDEE